MVLLVLFTVAEAEDLVEGADGSSRQTNRRGNSEAFSSSQKTETAYDLLMRTRRERPANKMPQTLSVGPVAARAELRLVRPSRGSPTAFLGFQRQDTTLVRPPELREVPPDAPSEPVYFVLQTGDRDIPGVTYRSTGGWRRIKLYLDTDGDGLLSDETEYVGTWLSIFRLFRTYQFGPVMARQGVITPGGDVFYAQCSDGRWLTFYPAFYREGKVLLNGKEYKIALIDHDFDGRFNKSFDPPAEHGRHPGCDIFAMDLDGDSNFDFGEAGESEIMPLSRLVKVNSDYYNIQASEDGSTIEFRPATPQFGTLDFGDQDVELRLWSDTGQLKLTGPGSKWRVPAGKYGVVYIELTEKDSEGNQWTFKSTRASVKTEKLGAFEVRPGQTTSFKVGPPFQIRTSMKKSGRNASVDFELEGQAGELYKPGAEKNKKTAPEPSLKIIDNSGQVVNSGRFKYG